MSDAMSFDDITLFFGIIIVRLLLMNENYVELDVPFSTADTIGKAELSYKDRHLKLNFRQFDDATIMIEFSDVIGFRWDDNYLSQVKVAPDRVYEIENSEWKSELHKELRIKL